MSISFEQVVLDAPLSQREIEVLQLVADGHSNVGISYELRITVKTVKNHLSRIYAAFGLPINGAGGWNPRMLAVRCGVGLGVIAFTGDLPEQTAALEEK